MANLSQAIAKAIDRGGAIEQRLGMPWRRVAILRIVDVDDEPPYLQRHADSVLVPWPSITSIPPRMIGLPLGNEEQTIMVAAHDLILECSRSFEAGELIREDSKRARFWIDAVLDDGEIQYVDAMKVEIVGGHEYSIIHVFDECHCLKMLLRREGDRR